MNDDSRQAIFKKKYDDCLALFLKYNGKNISRIQREMRGLGHTNFSRRILYSRVERGIYKPGWIERFGWRPGTAGTLACTDSVSSPRVSKGALSNGRVTDMTLRPDDPFHVWLKRVSPGMRWDWKHQVYIYKHLQKVTSGECKRLMIFLPPRHGKSELVTVRYSAWRLHQDPSLNIILGSYNQRLANRFSRKVRRVLVDAGVVDTSIADPPSSTVVLPHVCPKKACSSGDAEPARAGHGSKTAENHCQHTCSNCGGSLQASGLQAPASVNQGNISNGINISASRPANSLAEWETGAGGGLRAVGVGAGITGFGAGLIIIDDPVKSRAEAESETFRDNVWDWFNDDLYTRLEPNGAIVLIQTRWHEDDLAGRLIKEMEDGGDQWDIINLPALAEPEPVTTPCGDTPVERDDGAPILNSQLSILNSADPLGRAVGTTPCGDTPVEHDDGASILNSQLSILNSADPLGRAVGQALCPERYDEAALARTRRKLGSYSFSALYQQRPTPPDGGLFKRRWFKRVVNAPPAGLKWKRGYDLAVSTKTTADYTASFRCAFDAAGNLYIDGGFRKRIEFPEQRRFIMERIIEEKDTEHAIELALHGQAVLQELRREARLRGRSFRGVKVETDKLTRALSWANLAEEGKVILVRGSWNAEFLDEVCQFPMGRFDDQVDAVSLAVKFTTERRRLAYGF